MTNQIKQFGCILDLMKFFDTEQKCTDHLTKLRWGGNVISPFDKESKVYVCKGNKYKCKNTGKYFNVRTGTFFDDTKIPLQKWFVALWLMSSHKKSISSHQLAKDIGVTQKTAWYMLHRLRNTLGHSDHNSTLEGTVEIDETYVGGKESNNHSNKKSKNPQSLNNKSTVVGVIQREGNLTAKVVDGSKAKQILPVLLKNVKPNSIVMTDQSSVYARIDGYYQHQVVNHSTGEYVNGINHTNTIEGFWSLMKRGIYGIYHHASHKHLQKYVNEFAFRYNTRSIAEMIRFNYILTNVSGTKMSYNTLIQKKK